MSDISSSKSLIQYESIQLRSAVSESTFTNIGAAVNYILMNALPLGTVLPSMLTESQFQIQAGTQWILCDGRSIIGSDLQILTSQTTAIDLRGKFPRARSFGQHGVSDTSIGTYVADQLRNHIHNTQSIQIKVRDINHTVGQFEPYISAALSNNTALSQSPSGPDRFGPVSSNTALATGSAETRPNARIVNYFLKINRK